MFGASAAVLMLEIIAGRVLAPYVGISLETFTGMNNVQQLLPPFRAGHPDSGSASLAPVHFGHVPPASPWCHSG